MITLCYHYVISPINLKIDLIRNIPFRKKELMRIL